MAGEFASGKGIELGEGHVHGVKQRRWDQTRNFPKCQWINISGTCPLTTPIHHRVSFYV
jgi:hypothetical protein